MERESFEDQEVADLLNQDYIAIKVDREERPDVDHIYMQVCQALTGQGGWPLTIMMTPDKSPFFAGTYFPKNSKWGRPGLMAILTALSQQWRQQRDSLNDYAEEILKSIDAREPGSPYSLLSEEQVHAAFHGLARYFDSEYGGFSSAPKFPTPHNLLFLMRYWRHTGEAKAMDMVEKTLQSMRRGGIYDHLGFGFARYSVDHQWLVPHFEKMLYDNALLCYIYAEAFQATGNKEYAQVAEEIIAYVQRDMTGPAGGFYSAEDADSEGEEGKFYLWTKEEILRALGWTQGTIFADYYHVTAEGNFDAGSSILHTIGREPGEYAAKVGMKPDEFQAMLQDGREKLRELRNQRVHPFKDDKVLTSWNALMIAALAKAARVLDKPQYLFAASQALNFIEIHLTRQDGRLLARHRAGESAYLAYLDDYAYLLWAVIELYETTLSAAYLEMAKGLAGNMVELFWDEKQGGFFFTGSDAEKLISRPKEIYDGATPSGNSAAAYALLRLARITEDADLLTVVERLFEYFAGEVSQAPRAFTFFLMAFDYYLMPPQNIIIAGVKDDIATVSLLKQARKYYMPEVVLVLNSPDQAETLRHTAPHVTGRDRLDGLATAYVCHKFSCQRPVTSVRDLERLLAGIHT
ncbi:thioredoxin domain-containing protein [Acetonema longum]|uniref:Spermatogenesis-associated protein 20-like TRX domain-containing protein n=1 Tax=Acetonema longum DSM 6540 TaxID=1009370 RepID=F7NI68_9FIRM|nr:thioredoxin domain-containing protein [Acetonema longum]EGO64300.1 hypothetical protein ALO_08830 [Acetonema longum DSM 6540]